MSIGRTRLFHILVHDHKMRILPPCSPTRDPSHLEALPLLSPDEFRAREDRNDLFTKFVRDPRRLLRGSN